MFKFKPHSILLLFVSLNCFSQSINDYKYLVLKKQYGFQEEINEYRLNSNAGFLLKEQGFQILFEDDVFPDDLAKDRCKAMYLDMAPKEAFMAVKLVVAFKDCNNKVLFTCIDGVSKEKIKKEAYNEALLMALNSVKSLKYKYNGEVAARPIEVQNPVSGNVLSAKAITNGFQLLDSQNNTVMTVRKTSNKDCFLVIKNNIQGVLIQKDSKWFFEYYLNSQLVSEEVKVVF